MIDANPETRPQHDPATSTASALPAVAASLFVHVLIAGIVLAWPTSPPTPAEAGEQIIIVNLSPGPDPTQPDSLSAPAMISGMPMDETLTPDPAASPPPALPAPAETGPPAPPMPGTITKNPTPDPAPEPAPEPARKPLPQAPSPATPLPAAMPATAPPTAPRADSPSAQPPRQPHAPASAASANPLTRYAVRLAAQIEPHKHYPLAARRRQQEGMVIIRLSVDRDGTLIAAVGTGTAPALLTAAALSAVQDAAPFPPLPPDHPGSRADFELPMAFRLR